MTRILDSLLDLVRRARLHFRGIEFHLDTISANTFSGWARNSKQSSYRPLVEIRAGGKVLGYSHAQDFREDLLTANIGDGCYGFTVAPAVPLDVPEPISVDIYVDGLKANSRKYAVKPAFDSAFKEFSDHIERRLDGLLALHKERSDRELAEIRKQLSALSAK